MKYIVDILCTVITLLINEMNLSMKKYFFQTYATRSSHQRCSVKKSVLKIFAKFTEKHLCQGHF